MPYILLYFQNLGSETMSNVKVQNVSIKSDSYFVYFVCLHEITPQRLKSMFFEIFSYRRSGLYQSSLTLSQTQTFGKTYIVAENEKRKK